MRKRVGESNFSACAFIRVLQPEAGGNVVSGDRDTFQFATDDTTIRYLVRAGEMARIGPDEVRAVMGSIPSRFRIHRFARYPSDKVPGAPGVGAVGAETLLQRYGSLEAARCRSVFYTGGQLATVPINRNDESKGPAA